MFGFFKPKKKQKVVDTTLRIDLHSHLLPGIDDGAQSMDESLRLIRALAHLGYTKCITTPHIMCDAYGNTKVSILSALQELKEALIAAEIEMEIEAAAEYYVDEGLEGLIEKNELLLIADKYLLFETSYSHKPQQFEEIIFQIQTAGHTPLLAHPERYRYIKNPEVEYPALKALGVEFQVNLNSFNGHYGKSAEKNAQYLNDLGLIDFLGSDTHNLGHVENLGKVLKSKQYREIYQKNKIKNSLLG